MRQEVNIEFIFTGGRGGWKLRVKLCKGNSEMEESQRIRIDSMYGVGFELDLEKCVDLETSSDERL